MTRADAATQMRSHLGWPGPAHWPTLRLTRVAPFNSMWLANNAKRRAKKLPRVVASPTWQGVPRNDFVCVLQETSAGAHAQTCRHKLYLPNGLTSPSTPK